MKQILIRLIILIIILSASVYFIYKDYSASKSKNAEVIVPPLPVVVTGSSSADIKIPSVDTVPNLDKAWVIPEDYSIEAKRILRFKIDERTKDLKNNSDQYDKWIDLGILRKTVGDYDEARNIWGYAALSWPDSFVAYHNLGDLYANFLKDNIKAEENMIKVINLDARYISEYLSLYELYKRMYGEAGDKTEAILLRGVGNNPESVDLLMAIALHFKEVNDRDNAKKYYKLTLDQAEKLNNTSLVKDIQLELNSF